jgi:hypothetical protein
LQSLANRNAVSHDEVEAASINFETAKRKVDVLRSVAQAAYESGKADTQHAEELFEKGYATRGSVLSSRSNLKLLESILGASDPASDATPKTTPPRR